MPAILEDKQELAWGDGRKAFQAPRQGRASTNARKTRQQEVFPGHMAVGFGVLSLCL